MWRPDVSGARAACGGARRAEAARRCARVGASSPQTQLNRDKALGTLGEVFISAFTSGKSPGSHS